MTGSLYWLSLVSTTRHTQEAEMLICRARSSGKECQDVLRIPQQCQTLFAQERKHINRFKILSKVNVAQTSQFQQLLVGI